MLTSPPFLIYRYFQENDSCCKDAMLNAILPESDLHRSQFLPSPRQRVCERDEGTKRSRGDERNEGNLVKRRRGIGHLESKWGMNDIVIPIVGVVSLFLIIGLSCSLLPALPSRLVVPRIMQPQVFSFSFFFFFTILQ